MEQGWKGNGQEKYHDVDLLLLRHEFEELTLMAKYGYNASDAHDKANEKYLWAIAIERIERIK
jgi:hypothetical protein